ncbi:phosphatase PAP2 family protein [Halopiger goleimassiliensis]|uniref:phosphatase PAP2 family protein n=1 Tax=Halopiger goleimassiliensis TaxID=1293048 RepID=UPI0006782FED|nr:phosphatase PAP2 family protein [Halopiger goleimassiliensis]
MLGGTLVAVVFELAAVVTTMLVAATLVIVGPRRLVAACRDARWRLRSCLLPLAALAAVLFVRWATGDLLTQIEWRILGQNITYQLFVIDVGLLPVAPVEFLQSLETPELTAYFVFVYIYGYAFLLLFPFVAYFALEEVDDLSTLLVAFTANYAIGLLLYIVFIAYGPRNFDPLLFEGLLYDAFPRAHWLTNQVNQNTNVFPSLHTSLSMTVFFLAWHTREKYPLWAGLSGVLAISIVVSTMYLGIHWFADVVGGTVLAMVSVYLARRYTIAQLLRSVLRGIDGVLTSRNRPGSE